MADQHDSKDEIEKQRKADERIIESKDYTGPDRRKSPRRVIDQGRKPTNNG